MSFRKLAGVMLAAGVPDQREFLRGLEEGAKAIEKFGGIDRAPNARKVRRLRARIARGPRRC